MYSILELFQACWTLWNSVTSHRFHWATPYFTCPHILQAELSLAFTTTSVHILDVGCFSAVFKCHNVYAWWQRYVRGHTYPFVNYGFSVPQTSHTPASRTRRSAQYVTDICMYICALHSSISWSLSLLPNRHVTVSETDVQLKEEVLFMPGISNYGPPADFLWPSSIRTK